MQRKALAQIPLILGLLVMAIAIPVATKLVQENQDSRNQAAGCAGINQSCSTRPCCAGLTCADESSGFSSPRCISNVDNCPQGHRKCEGNNQYYCNAGNWVLEKACGSLGCDGDGCRAPACSGTETRCNDSGNQVLQCNNGVWKLLSNCPYGCINGACKASPSVSPPPAEMCSESGAQRCYGNVLHDCVKPDTDGTTRDVVCSTDGLLATCGGKNYCCPKAGGLWTPDMTNCSRANELCPKSQQCGGKVLHDCALPDIDGTSRDVPCDVAGVIEFCGGKKYCCPKNGGVWTDDLRQCPLSVQMCPGSQKCLAGNNVLYDCVKPDADGTSRDVVCKAPGIVDTCGGKNYCCPKAGGVWTTDMGQCPPPSERCPDAQKCFGKVLYDCVKPDADGSTRESICNIAGRKETCGGVDYCCPANGAIWTTDMSKCPGFVSPTGWVTSVPTRTPTARPTLSCAETNESCTTRSCCLLTDICIEEGLSYPKCVPRNKIPTYIPMPCVGAGKSCATKLCCEGLTCTDDGLSYPTCIENCSLLTNRPDNCKCTSDSQCKSKKCLGGVCKPVGPVITGVVPTGDPGPRPSDKCPGAQACPDSTGRILRDCKKPDSDGTSRDIICNTVGQKDTCGGVEYCCPAIGGKWTTNMTQCPAGNCTQCSNDPGAKGKGDADCSRFTNLTDYSIWKEDYIAGDLGTSVKNTWRADFNCDGKVDLVNDYLIWKNYYIKTLQ